MCNLLDADELIARVESLLFLQGLALTNLSIYGDRVSGITVVQSSTLVEYNRFKIIGIAEDNLPYIIISSEDTRNVEGTLWQDGIGKSCIT